MSFVFFWGSKHPFSNWYPARFVIRDVTYANSEQYMMAAKARIFQDLASEAAILSEPNPASVKALGRRVAGYDEARWLQCREKVMFDGCYAKFSQNPRLCEQLLATGDAELVEASPYDRIWGIGLAESDPRAHDKTQWRGLNLLGLALMRVRDRIASSNQCA